VTRSRISIELSEGQLRSVIRGALSSRQGLGGLASLDLSYAALSKPAGRVLSAEMSDGTLSTPLIRGLLVFAAFREGGPPRGASEIAQELRMSSSTVHRFIRTLAAIGLLQPESRSRLYRRPSRSTRARHA
jgi:hypothetical protein